MYDQKKLDFLRVEFITHLKKLSGNEKGNWGVLSPQGMIEHMSDSISIASEKNKFPLQTPKELVSRSKAFAMSDKEFKPGTKNSLMSEEAAPLRHANIAEAISELENCIQEFIQHFSTNPEKTVQNPFFGDLNFEEWLTLLAKHARHHLRQFNLL